MNFVSRFAKRERERERERESINTGTYANLFIIT